MTASGLCLGTLMEGIAAFDFDGRFLGANDRAQFQLGLPLTALRAHTLSSLFGLTSAQLFERMHHDGDGAVPLILHDGTVVCAHAGLRRAFLASRPGASDAVRRTARMDTRLDMPPVRTTLPPKLAQLDTGDPQVASVVAKVRKIIGKDIPV